MNRTNVAIIGGGAIGASVAAANRLGSALTGSAVLRTSACIRAAFL